MKIAIIGAGNMGGAIACGLAASGEYKAGEIVCSNPSCGKLEALKSRYEIIATTTDNISAAEGADMVIVAVKPWLAEGVQYGDYFWHYAKDCGYYEEIMKNKSRVRTISNEDSVAILIDRSQKILSEAPITMKKAYESGVRIRL